MLFTFLPTKIYYQTLGLYVEKLKQAYINTLNTNRLANETQSIYFQEINERKIIHVMFKN